MPKEYLIPSEITQLEASTLTLRDRLLVRILFRLGCRVSEALAITTHDIDFINSRVSIIHLKARLNLNCRQCGARLSLSHAYCPSCGIKTETSTSSRLEKRKMRTLPIDTDTLRLIKEYIDSGATVVKEGKTFIFGFGRHRAWQIIKESAIRGGLPELRNPESGKIHNVSPHKLRDAFAVHAMKLDDSGEGMRFLQEHLGHTSFNTTAKYRKVAGEEHQAWYSKLWAERLENKG